MKYPKLLKNNDLIGITALSSGASDCVDEMNLAIDNLKKDFKVEVTKNVFGNYVVSSSNEERVKELDSLLDKKVKMIFLSRGGDYLYETLDKIDFNKIKKSNIWIEGASDATALLYILTTKYDLATLYGRNAKQFSLITDDIRDNMKLLMDNNYIQKNYGDRKVISVNGDFKDSGIVIGGCFDSIKDLIGTKFDNTNKFIEKYKDKGIIWYFDIFSMSSLSVYITLLQLKNAGWFKYSKTFIFGSVKYPTIYGEISYEDAIKKALKEYDNILIDANIGHIKPVNTIINGSYLTINYKNEEYTLLQEFFK